MSNTERLQIKSLIEQQLTELTADLELNLTFTPKEQIEASIDNLTNFYFNL